MKIYPLDWQYNIPRIEVCSYCSLPAIVRWDGTGNGFSGYAYSCRSHLYVGLYLDPSPLKVYINRKVRG